MSNTKPQNLLPMNNYINNLPNFEINNTIDNEEIKKHFDELILFYQNLIQIGNNNLNNNLLDENTKSQIINDINQIKMKLDELNKTKTTYNHIIGGHKASYTRILNEKKELENSYNEIINNLQNNNNLSQPEKEEYENKLKNITNEMNELKIKYQDLIETSQKIKENLNNQLLEKEILEQEYLNYNTSLNDHLIELEGNLVDVLAEKEKLELKFNQNYKKWKENTKNKYKERIELMAKEYELKIKEINRLKKLSEASSSNSSNTISEKQSNHTLEENNDLNKIEDKSISYNKSKEKSLALKEAKAENSINTKKSKKSKKTKKSYISEINEDNKSNYLSLNDNQEEINDNKSNYLSIDDVKSFKSLNSLKSQKNKNSKKINNNKRSLLKGIKDTTSGAVKGVFNTAKGAYNVASGAASGAYNVASGAASGAYNVASDVKKTMTPIIKNQYKNTKSILSSSQKALLNTSKNAINKLVPAITSGTKGTINLLDKSSNLISTLASNVVIPLTGMAINQGINLGANSIEGVGYTLNKLGEGIGYVNEIIKDKKLQILNEEINNDISLDELINMIKVLDINAYKQLFDITNTVIINKFGNDKSTAHQFFDNLNRAYLFKDFKLFAQIILDLNNKKEGNLGKLYSLIFNKPSNEKLTYIKNDIGSINNEIKSIQNEIKNTKDKDKKKLLSLELNEVKDVKNLLDANLKINERLLNVESRYPKRERKYNIKYEINHICQNYSKQALFGIISKFHKQYNMSYKDGPFFGAAKETMAEYIIKNQVLVDRAINDFKT